MVKILVDAFGGDNCPVAQVRGALLACKENGDLFVTLVGNETLIFELLDKFKTEGLDVTKISVLHAPETIGADEVPTQAIAQKKESSMVKLLTVLKEDDSFGGAVSAGNTGALLAGAFKIVRRIDGVSRPALAASIPTLNGKQTVFLDCGANAECKPEHLLEFALMGSAYAKVMFLTEKPKVALLSNGTEDNKGTSLVIETFKLLSDNDNFAFIGNIEARDILGGDADVVVTDGFTGNVALKASEGMASGFFTLLKREIKNGGLRAKIGYLLLKKQLRAVKRAVDYNEIGGGVFVGIQKPVIKAHGASGEKAMRSAILQAAKLADGGLSEKIKAALNV